MQEVTIIGAGMSGLTAALRLAERGYKVTIYERDSFIGGKFRATEWKARTGKRSAFHEHSYHMFLNWYHNFWQIAHEIGAFDDFLPMTKVKFMQRGQFPRMKELENFGAPSALLQNLCSGVLSVPDMLLYMYSVVDLLGTPMDLKEERYRDLISVNSFAATKLYATEASASLYDEYLAKTFSIASYESSAKTFQTFMEYGAYCPTPLYWALDGDCFNHFLKKVLLRLKELRVDIRYRHNAIGLRFDQRGRVSAVDFADYDESTYDPSLSEMPVDDFIEEHKEHCKPNHLHPVKGPLIIAVPHGVLYQLLAPAFLNLDPDLGEIAKLRSVAMASVHLHLNEKFSDRMEHLGVTLPAEPVVLVDSKYKLSFVANSSLWSGSSETYLNVVASDSRPLERLPAPQVFTDDWKWHQYDNYDDAPGRDDLSIQAPLSSLDHILNEFRQFVHFEDDEIDLELLHIDRNVGRELFINDVGSWKWRPQTRTKIANLFLAGDYTQHFIDVVSLEGAVVSGLNAAQCVQQQYGIGEPIRIIRPNKHPPYAFWPLKVAMAPYAAAAKVCAMFGDLMRRASN